MNLRPALFIGLLGPGSALLAGCGEPSPAHRPPRPAPTVVEVVRHYGNQLARGTRLTTKASRSFADSVANLSPNNSFDIDWGTCAVEGWVDSLQRLTVVYVMPPYKKWAPRSSLDLPNPNLLVRLGTLRRAFGPGLVEPNPILTKLESSRCYSVTFEYQPVPGRRLKLHACLPTADYADSVRVNDLYLYAFP